MKQLRNISRVLVVLVLVISASSFFIGCNQPSGSGSDEASGGNNASKVIVIEPTQVTEDKVIYAISGNTVTYSDFNKSERSTLGLMMMNVEEEAHTITYKCTFNEDFTKVTISDMKMDGGSVSVAEEERLIVLKDGFYIQEDPETNKIIKINYNPLINKLK